MKQLPKPTEAEMAILTVAVMAGLLFTPLWVGHAAAQKADKPSHGEIAVRSAKWFEVSLPQGSIEISASAGTNLVVEVYRSDSRDQALEKAITLMAGENRVTARLPGNSSADTTYRFLVPKQWNVDLKTSRGQISVGDFPGEVKASASSGNLRLGRIGGALDLNVSAGSIYLVAANGPIKAKTSGGNLKLGQLNGKAFLEAAGGAINVRQAASPVEAKTSGGAIKVFSASDAVKADAGGNSVYINFVRQPSGESDLRSSSSLHIKVPAELNLVVEAHGKVRGDLPVAWNGERDSDTPHRGTLNGGNHGVVLRAKAPRIGLALLKDKNALRVGQEEWSDQDFKEHDNERVRVERERIQRAQQNERERVQREQQRIQREQQAERERKQREQQQREQQARSERERAKAEAEREANVRREKVIKTGGLSARTVNGMTTITLNGQEVWSGPTRKNVTIRSSNINGALKLVVLDGDTVLWENQPEERTEPAPPPVKMLAPGVLLRDGTKKDGAVLSVDETGVKFKDVNGHTEILVRGRISTLLLQPVPEARKDILERNRRGLLLVSGDFFEGDLVQIESGQITMSSVLFGLRRFSISKEAAAVVLRGPTPQTTIVPPALKGYEPVGVK